MLADGKNASNFCSHYLRKKNILRQVNNVIRVIILEFGTFTNYIISLARGGTLCNNNVTQCVEKC